MNNRMPNVQDPDPSSTKMCQRFMKDIVVKPSVPRYTVPSVAPFAYQEEHYSAILRTYVKSRREQLDALASLQATMSSDDVSGSTPAKSSGAGDLQKAPGRGEAPQEKTDEQAEDQAQEEAAEDSCKPHDPKVQGPTKRCIINLAHGTEGKADWVYYKTMIASDCYRLYCEGKVSWYACRQGWG